jgi:hypothetical protein
LLSMPPTFTIVKSGVRSGSVCSIPMIAGALQSFPYNVGFLSLRDEETQVLAAR